MAERRLLALATAERTGEFGLGVGGSGTCPKLRLEAILEFDPNNADALTEFALIQLGDARMRAQRLPISEEIFRREDGRRIPRSELVLVEKVLVRARGVEPEQAKTINALGVVAAEMEEYSTARDYFTMAGDLAPHITPPLLNLAGLAIEFKEFSKAERLYTEALVEATHELDARLGLSVAMLGRAADDGTAALERRQLLLRTEDLLRETARLYPEHPEVLFNLASVVLVEMKYAEIHDDIWTRLNEAETLFLGFLNRARDLPSYQRGIRTASCKYVEIRDSTFVCFPDLTATGVRRSERKRSAILSELCDGTRLDVPNALFESLDAE